MSKRESLLTGWLREAASAGDNGLRCWTGDDPRWIALDLNAENVSLRAQLAAKSAECERLREALTRLLREVGITMEQWSEEQKAGRPGVVFGSRMGQLADVANTSLAALAPRDEKPAVEGE